jgi:mono/diheme cytochrome c family protein
MRTVRGVLWGGFGFALLFCGLLGCDQPRKGYDPSLTYQLRTDPLVVQLPPVAPIAPAAAGKLDESIAALPTVGGKILDPKTLPAEQQNKLRQTLDELFGTPAAPRVVCMDRPRLVGELDLSPEHLAAGSRVYRRLCNQCHGINGDGRGPTGPWVYPYPRDFRQGVFKSAHAGTKPRSETLVKLIRSGVPATSMQAFDLIPDEDVRAAAAYVIHLSLRGEVEFRVTKALLDDSGEVDASDVQDACQAELTRGLDQWLAAQAQAAPPNLPTSDDPKDSAYQESVRRGHRLFTATAGGGCASCHQDYGRAERYQYSVWGTVVRVPDLTRGEFRWGKDTPSMSAHIRHGIAASGMPGNPFLNDEQVRDLANFVREAGYPARLPTDVRQQVYPAGKPTDDE